jgi:hypothetical protein
MIRASRGHGSRSIAWAAYSAAHWTTVGPRRQSALWSCRDLVVGGRLRPPGEEPEEVAAAKEATAALAAQLPDRDGHLRAACDAVAEAAYSTARVARLLRGGGTIDPDVDPASPVDLPAGIARWYAAFDEVQKGLAPHAHFGRWALLGEWVATADDKWWGRLPAEATTTLIGHLRTLNAEGRYPMLTPLLEFLNSGTATDAGLARELVDGIFGGVTAKTVHGYLLKRLAGAHPRPLVHVRADEAEFFGQVICRDELAGAGWTILRALARRANEAVTRAELVREAKLSCAPNDVPPHLARLRKRLQPAVDRHYAQFGMPAPAGADAAFIVAARVRGVDGRGGRRGASRKAADDPRGGYSLAIPAELVSVASRHD